MASSDQAFPHSPGAPGQAPRAPPRSASPEADRQRAIERLLEAAIEAQQVDLLLELARRAHARRPTPSSRARLDRESRSALDHEKRFERLWQEAEATGLVDPLGRAVSPPRARAGGRS